MPSAPGAADTAAEVEATAARRLAGRLRFAHYPLGKRLAGFEFDYQPSIDRAVIADALAKGIFILGPDAGMALIEKLPHVDGVIVSAKNEVLISSGLRSRLEILAPPTDAP